MCQIVTWYKNDIHQYIFKYKLYQSNNNVMIIYQTTQSVIAFAIILNHNRRIRAINLSRPLLFSLQVH